MKSFSMIAVTLALLAGPAGLARADEPKKDEKQKDDVAAKLVGAWEVTKATDEAIVGATITFAKDGKFTVAATVGGQDLKLEGTYKLEKGKLVTEMKAGDETMSDTDTIKKLTATEMELENKDGKVTVMKKKK